MRDFVIKSSVVFYIVFHVFCQVNTETANKNRVTDQIVSVWITQEIRVLLQTSIYYLPIIIYESTPYGRLYPDQTKRITK
jgi:hypothetical protein